ncbi:hypothetical protein B0H17DRAFT_1112146 [Mycena rosella]|uniref:HNH nuclease domain-containing protein n=1 Tax=Mycena rosella TaxID=1033263 RepID=A0AAD7BJD3_MYCRO|nr:hypothetical protein B0H17DRAFT_1112146 [Mycena rosella]
MSHTHNLSISSFCSTLSINSDDFLEVFENDHYDNDELVSEAHGIVNKHRRSLIQAAPKGSKYHLDKLLDAMLDHAPTPLGARYVAVALHVAATKDDNGSSVVGAAKAWLDQLVLPMLTIATDNRSEPSSSQTPTLDETAQVIESAGRKEQREFRTSLAKRERYYCAITQTFDRDRVDFLDAQQRSNEVPRVPAHKMVAAHIIPLFLNNFNDAGEHKTGVHLRDAAYTWDMLQSWTQIDLQGLVGSKITSPQNGIYMTSDDHDNFGAFKFYLDKAAFPNDVNKYEARCLRNRLSNGESSSIVTFSDQEPPKPEYLQIHAAFAKVLHLSGAAAHLQDLQRDAERMEMLHLDGLADFGQALTSKLAVLSGGAVYIKPQYAY